MKLPNVSNRNHNTNAPNAAENITNHINDNADDILKYIVKNKLVKFPKYFKPKKISPNTLSIIESAELTGPPTIKNSEPHYSKSVMTKKVMDNKSNTVQSFSFTYDESTQDVFSFGFTEGVTLGSQISVGATIEIIEIGQSFSMEMSLEANQQWTTTNQRTWSESYTIEVPAQTKIEVSSYIDDGFVESEFEAELKISKVVVILEFIGDMEFDDREPIRNMRMPFSLSYDITKLPKELIFYNITGVLSASIGIQSAIDVEQLTQV